MGTVITFYSYKGGVGRTMALANIAVILARWGRKVLVVDWDLEAPGVEHFFLKDEQLVSIQSKPGLVDLLTQLSNLPNDSVDNESWRSLLTNIIPEPGSAPISLLTAGCRDQGYFSNVRQLDVKNFYENKNGGNIIEQLRRAWKTEFDFVLIDSRTGITDIGGICTIQLPDVLAIVFTATEQSLNGAIEVAKKASSRRQELPFDRSLVPIVPIPCRFDTQTEHKVAQDWLERFENALAPFYHQWLPAETNRRNFLELTKVPYTAYFSFGEGLPVLEQGTTDPVGLGYAYETLTALLANNLENANLLVTNRDEIIRLAKSPRQEFNLESSNNSILFCGIILPSQLFPSVDLMSRSIETIRQIVSERSGTILMATSSGALCGFLTTTAALTCALRIQECFAVEKPIVYRSGPVRVRLVVHINGATVPDDSNENAFRIAELTRENEVVISNPARALLSWSQFDIEFREKSEQLEVAQPGDVLLIKLFEVIKFTVVTLNDDELNELYGQDPSSRSGGGFQALLVSLQEKVKDKTLALTVADRERIARYAHDYRSGGWQGRLRRIFGRTLGSNLGREKS